MAALVAPVASTSMYALEWTAAHQLCDMCLQSGQDAIEFIDRRIPIGTHVFIVDEEMASAVQVYLDVCREYLALEDWECLIEKRFSLDSLDPPGPMFGTA